MSQEVLEAKRKCWIQLYADVRMTNQVDLLAEAEHEEA